MLLKELSVNDKDIIEELFLSVFTNEPWNDDWSDRDQLRRYLTDLTGNANSLALGFFDGEKLVGVAMGQIKHWYSGTEYFIDELCISRELQGKGIGTAFVGDIRGYLKEHGINRIFLLTGRDVPAYSFYTKRGFSEAEALVPLYSTFE